MSDTIGPLILIIFDELVLEQEFTSVTVTVYVPGIRLPIEDVVELFDHKYEKPPAPPDTNAVRIPLELPQVAWIVLITTTTKFGAPRVVSKTAVHPLASVTVKV